MAIFKKASITPIVRSVVSQGLEDQYPDETKTNSTDPFRVTDVASVERILQGYIKQYEAHAQQAKDAEDAMPDYYEAMGKIDGLMLALIYIKKLK